MQGIWYSIFCSQKINLLVFLIGIAAWFRDVAPGGCQILAGSRMPLATRKVTVGVAVVSVMGVN
jgi:hypothetical protein